MKRRTATHCVHQFHLMPQVQVEGQFRPSEKGGPCGYKNSGAVERGVSGNTESV